MKPRIALAKKSVLLPLMAGTLLLAGCSQQPAVPEAGNGNGGGKTGSAGHQSGNDNNKGKGGVQNAGSRTQGVNIGNGTGVKSTGGGTYGYNQGQAGGNTLYYQYGKNGTGIMGDSSTGNKAGQANSANSAQRDSAITLKNLKNTKSLLSRRIIYFDYDQATIKPQYQAILDAHSKLLAKYPNVSIRLEGHADERGTREYNVALSEERAKAVQWIMRSKGVKRAQTEVIAYGEERPAVIGDGEKSWAKNRRVEIKYPGQ